jgi:hypothetical protein
MQPGLSSNDECHGSGGGEADPNAVVAPVFNLTMIPSVPVSIRSESY